MTCNELRSKVEGVFYYKIIPNKKNRLCYEQSIIHGVFYNIGKEHFNFTFLEMSECLGYKKIGRATGFCEDHYRRLEKNPLYNYVYLQAKLKLFNQNN